MNWIESSKELPAESQDCFFVLETPEYTDIYGEHWNREIKVHCGNVEIMSSGKRYWRWLDGDTIPCIINEYVKEYDGEQTYVTHWMKAPNAPAK